MKHLYIILFTALHLVSFNATAQCATPSLVPYYEGFQGITANNQLPPCWAVSNPTACITFTSNVLSGNGGGFFSNPLGSRYFYTNGIQLQAGVTYSISSWYKIDFAAAWTDFSMLIGPNQSTTGLVVVASTNGPVFNTTYAALSSTFTVASTGTYYTAIRSTCTAMSGQVLAWDDLAITVPCNSGSNTPVINIAASATAACQNALNQLTLTASGGDLYSWNTGATTPSITGSQSGSGPYQVTGTSTLTGCTATAGINIIVNPAPAVSIVAISTQVCSGGSIMLAAVGANTYSWSTEQPGSIITVYPNTTTVYTVTGTNGFGCSASSELTISVLPTPTISSISPTLVCLGDLATINANVMSSSGNVTYQWQSAQSISVFNPLTVNPLANTAYTLSVTDIAYPNCIAKAQFTLEVNACTGLDGKVEQASGATIHPNPSTGIFVLDCAKAGPKTIEVSDITGRRVFASVFENQETVDLDLRHLPQGVYQVSILAGSFREQLKVIKQDH